MIQSVRLHNFESHQDSLFEFVPGVNIIVGATDSGKTAVIRSLKKAITNRPLGNDFVSWPEVNDGEDSSIEIKTDTDTIVRSTGKQEEYKLNDMVFHAFGTSVPEEVVKALNMNEINLKTQFESHFLLSLSAGEVASHYNKVARLDKIDRGTSNVNSWISQINSTIGVPAKKDKPATGLIKQIEDTTQAIAAFDYLPEFQKGVEELEETCTELLCLQENVSELQELNDKIERVDAEIEQEKAILTIEPLVMELLSMYEDREALRQQGIKLTGLKNNISDVEEALKEQSAILTTEPLVNELLELYNNREALSKDQVRLSNMINKINFNQKELMIADENLKRLEREFEEAFPAGSICPVCGKPK